MFLSVQKSIRFSLAFFVFVGPKLILTKQRSMYKTVDLDTLNIVDIYAI